MVTAVSAWRGIYPAICTPFTPEDEVDHDAQRRVVRFALEGGSHGLVLFGLAGEYLKLTARERMRLVDTILEEVDGSVPVFVGVGAESAAASCELARYATGAGASCIVAPAPLSTVSAGEGLMDYFERVAAEVAPLPMMIQDAPAYLGISLGQRFVEQVGARAENVRLVKLEAGPFELERWIAALGVEFSVWGGDGGMYQLDCLRVGAAGIIPGTDLIDILVRIYELEQGGDSAAADGLFARVLPTLVFEMQHSIDHYNHCAKHTLRRRGVELHPGLRGPAETFGDVSLRLLDRHLDELELTSERAPALG
jgi:dihydrodipicolinate synthase/N-acetylneuraminate lyase